MVIIPHNSSPAGTARHCEYRQRQFVVKARIGGIFVSPSANQGRPDIEKSPSFFRSRIIDSEAEGRSVHCLRPRDRAVVAQDRQGFSSFEKSRTWQRAAFGRILE